MFFANVTCIIEIIKMKNSVKTMQFIKMHDRFPHLERPACFPFLRATIPLLCPLCRMSSDDFRRKSHQNLHNSEKSSTNSCTIQKKVVPLQRICFYNALKLVHN